MRDYRVTIPAGRSVTLCSGQNTYIICREINTSSPAVPSVDVMAFSSVEAGRVVIDANFIASRWFRAKDTDAFTDVVATNNNLFNIECVFSIGRGEIADNVSAGDTFISGISSGVLPLPVTIPNTDLPLPVTDGTPHGVIGAVSVSPSANSVLMPANPNFNFIGKIELSSTASGASTQSLNILFNTTTVLVVTVPPLTVAAKFFETEIYIPKGTTLHAKAGGTMFSVYRNITGKYYV